MPWSAEKGPNRGTHAYLKLRRGLCCGSAVTRRRRLESQPGLLDMLSISEKGKFLFPCIGRILYATHHFHLLRVGVLDEGGR
jgi:hypothetical protein